MKPKKKSPIDNIFNDIYGFYPKKAGTAYEMFACMAEKLLLGGDVSHDEKLRGDFSETLYQIDVLSQNETDKSMGEVKDFTIRSGKVGRGDIQKLEGALSDLSSVSEGKFFSATGYTAPAIKYADASSSFPNNKPITLYDLRVSTDQDEQGIIKKINIKIKYIIPHPNNAKWKPCLTEKGENSLKILATKGESEITYTSKIEDFYDSNEAKILSFFELTSFGYGDFNKDTHIANGCFYLPDHHIKICNILTEIYGLEYQMPFSEHERIIEITDDSNHRFVLKKVNGNIIGFFSDVNIQDFKFTDDGKLITE